MINTIANLLGYGLMGAGAAALLACVYYAVMWLWWKWLCDGIPVWQLHKELTELRRRRRDGRDEKRRTQDIADTTDAP